MRFRLGDVTFDGEQSQLRRGQEPIALSPLARHLLEFLIEKSPRAVSTRELQKALGSGEPVPEWSLHALAGELRRALGDDPDEPRFIRMVHGFGYALEGGTSCDEEAPPAIRHRLFRDGRELPLEEGENVLGRDSCGICLDDGTVSRRHARITVSGGSATLEDLGSKNGTWWRDQRLEAALALTDGDEFGVGSVRLVYRGPGSGLETGTAHEPLHDPEAGLVDPGGLGASIGGAEGSRAIVHPEVTLEMFLAIPLTPPAQPPPVRVELGGDRDAPDDGESLAGRFE